MTASSRATTVALALAAVSLLPAAHAQDKTSNSTRPADMNQIPSVFNAPKTTPFEAPKAQSDYEKRIVMIPMRDGTKLYTVIVVQKARRMRPC